MIEIIKSTPLRRDVTFAGGAPFTQAGELAKVAKGLKDEGYEVASYSGYTFEQLLNGTKEQKMLLHSVDVLIDGPFILEERSLSLNFRGSKNQRILNVPESMKKAEAVSETSSRWLGEY